MHPLRLRSFQACAQQRRVGDMHRALSGLLHAFSGEPTPGDGHVSRHCADGPALPIAHADEAARRAHSSWAWQAASEAKSVGDGGVISLSASLQVALQTGEVTAGGQELKPIPQSMTRCEDFLALFHAQPGAAGAGASLGRRLPHCEQVLRTDRVEVVQLASRDIALELWRPQLPADSLSPLGAPSTALDRPATAPLAGCPARLEPEIAGRRVRSCAAWARGGWSREVRCTR